MASKKKYDPIPSYGVILYTRNEKGEIVFLLYQRRDTYEYMEFMRGIWAEYNLVKIFDRMTVSERERIRNYTFRELWDDLFVVKTYKYYHDSFEKSKKKYDGIRDSIPHYLDLSRSNILHTPWGFPKGKKNGHLEDSLVCAKREFEEETKFSPEHITFHEGAVYEEKYIGSNNRAYMSTYFVGKCDHPLVSTYMPTNHHIRKFTVSEEAEDVGWFTFEQAKLLLDPLKIGILEQILKMLTENDSSTEM